MRNSVVLRGAGDVDLSRHGVIEAHAGTGKTYTIVQLVLRMLEQEPSESGRFINISNILLVTYTEKAAGELKKRIREGLEDRLEQLRADTSVHAGLIKRLEGCLNNVHEALIGTIHSVCLRLLQTWPFETGVHFVTEIVDDGDGLARALRESLRTDWQDEKNQIPWALAELEDRGQRLAGKHFDLICKTAKELLDEDNAVLDRSAIHGCRLADLNTIEIQARMHYNDFCAHLDALKIFLDDFIPPEGFNEYAIEKINSIRQWSHRMPDAVSPRDLDCIESITTFKKPDKNGVLRNTAICDAAYKKTPIGAKLHQVLDAVRQHPWVISQRTIEDALLLALICDAAGLLARRWNRAKREQGRVSYLDMLRLMYAAVMKDGTFLASLRERLRYGIIDEFQDTSVMQWKIFEKIFLCGEHGGGPRMFILGDPKQSIYAFQGADVSSYLNARDAIRKSGGILYTLNTNYRSTPEIIDGYNTILKPYPAADDWFGFGDGDDGIRYPSDGDGGGLAQPPVRTEPSGPARAPAVQVMTLEGNARLRRWRMAEWTARIVRALKGQTVLVPRGDILEERCLDYGDFAVIVEVHKHAVPFLEKFHQENIPAVKYKMEGVFQSPMARDLHTLLRAIGHRQGPPSFRLALLLTHFFNRRPDQVDPATDLGECRQGKDCRGDDACVAHAMDEWGNLADRCDWARLFRRIEERSGIRQRLIRLADGQRHLADLRQVMDHCMEKLCGDNVSLQQLVDYLGALLNNEERVGQDRNVHALSTERTSVKVLTMHAAKGLEFPVVFLVTGASRNLPSGANTLVWIGADGKRLVMPQLQRGDNKKAKNQIDQERRRLLYVAMTRPQAYLFLPMHLGSIIRDEDGNGDIINSPLPKKFPDKDLTPRLQMLVDGQAYEKKLPLFDAADYRPVDTGTGSSSAPGDGPALLDEIPEIDIRPLISRRTSYSQLSRGMDVALAREDDRSEEPAAIEAVIDQDERQQPILPGGAKTGDALHRIVEHLLCSRDIRTALGDETYLSGVVRSYLHRNGVLDCLPDPDMRERAITYALSCVRGPLIEPLALPNGDRVVIADLADGNRVSEMEFLLSEDRHWVHGYMDLVFRIANNGARHPWRYFVLDWKSNVLPQYDDAAIADCMAVHHYDLQARLYCHALDRHLHGLLGDRYDPRENLGGAVYVFLRAYGNSDLASDMNAWMRPAEPEGDAAFVRELLRDSSRQAHAEG